MKKLIIIMALSLFLTTVTFSQRKCGSDNYQDLNLKRYIGAENRTNILSEFAKDLTSLGKYNQEIIKKKTEKIKAKIKKKIRKEKIRQEKG
jgi:hypothetical protein